MLNRIKYAQKWLLVSVIIFKIILFAVFVFNFNAHWSSPDVLKHLVFVTADTPDYYEPIERLVNGEGYSVRVDDNNSGVYVVKPWTYRMPGLLPVYAPLYYLFGSDWGKVIVILLQLLIECLSVFALASVARSLFQSHAAWAACLILYGLNTFVSVYSVYAIAESFCISFLIFSFYFLLCRPAEKVNINLLLSGLFYCWAVFFRPAVVIMLPVMIVMTWFIQNSSVQTVSSRLYKVFLFLSVFLVADGAWTYRNWKNLQTFVPMYGDFSSIATKHELALYDLIIAWGGDIQNWNPGEGRWFIRPSDSKTRVYDPEFQKTNPFPTYIFTPDCNIDTLKNLRILYWKSFCCEKGADSASFYSAQFIKKAQNIKKSFVKHHPLHFFLLTKFRHASTFILIRRPYGLPFISHNLIAKLIRVATIAYYYVLLLLAFTGIIAAIRYSQTALFLILAMLMYIGVHIIFGYTEFRYILPAYPLMTLFATFGFVKIYNKYWDRRIKSTVRNYE